MLANDGPEKVNPHLRNKIAIANPPPRPRKVRRDAEIIPFPAIKQKRLADDALIATYDLSDDAGDRLLSAVVRVISGACKRSASHPTASPTMSPNCKRRSA